MPLLCISLLVLVLLPLSLSCDTNLAAFEDLSAILPTHMEDTRENLTEELQNISCQELKHKLPNCTVQTQKADIMETLFLQACDMLHLRLQQTKKVAEVVLNSLRRPCLKKSTKDPNARSHRRAMARNRAKKMKRLCKAKAILSSMTVCFEKLSTLCRR